MTNIHISWSDFDSMVNKLVNKINNCNIDFNNIYGIPRGGLPLAVSLSHKLNLPLILNEEDLNRNSLVVDDISDTGVTLSKFFRQDYAIATLFSSNWTVTKPNWFESKKLSKDDWIVMPWENKEIQRRHL